MLRFAIWNNDSEQEDPLKESPVGKPKPTSCTRSCDMCAHIHEHMFARGSGMVDCLRLGSKHGLAQFMQP